MLRATHRGVLQIGEIQIPCFVLEDGTRVISGRGMTKAIGMKGRGQGVERVTTHSTLKQYLGETLTVAIENPIHFIGSTSRRSNPTSGYEATILQELCDAILTAAEGNALRTKQELRYAQFSYVLIRALARVGIVALVDEVTGYQEERDRDELHRILQAYISEELLPWAKRFPDEFYEQLFRLKGWRYSPISVSRPQYVGTLTNELVYKKLPPGVLEELKNLNPTLASGRRRHKHHQLLTESIGHTHLERHLAGSIDCLTLSFTSSIARVGGDC